MLDVGQACTSRHLLTWQSLHTLYSPGILIVTCRILNTNYFVLENGRKKERGRNFEGARLGAELTTFKTLSNTE